MQEPTKPALRPTANTSVEYREAVKQAASDRASSRIATMSAAELSDLAINLLRRAAGSARVAHMAAQLSADSRPSASQIAKCIEAALFNTEEVLHLGWGFVTDNDITAISTDIDQAEGILAAIDAKLWDDGWMEIARPDSIAGALDAASHVLEACLRYLEARAEKGQAVTH
jgi:hypothetical protein